MFSIMKYIITEKGPVIFPNSLEHKKVAGCLQECPVISAGLVLIKDFEPNKLTCYGESLSLNIKSRAEEDTNILKNFLKVH